MIDDDMLRRGDVLKAIHHALVANPAHDGARKLAGYVVSALPAVQPDDAAIREAALREALEAVNAKWRSGADTPDEMRGLALAEAAILALIDKPGHVNEPPKSEHEAEVMLTPATKGGAHD